MSLRSNLFILFILCFNLFIFQDLIADDREKNDNKYQQKIKEQDKKLGIKTIEEEANIYKQKQVEEDYQNKTQSFESNVVQKAEKKLSNNKKTSINKKRKSTYNFQIKLLGNKKISEELIKNLIYANEINEINEVNLNKLLVALYGTNLCADIKISYEGGVLTISVKENRIINNINVKGEKDIKDENIKELFELRPGSVLNEYNLNQAIKKLEEFFMNNGYYNVIITKNIVEVCDDYVDINIEVKKGARPKIEEIKFIGAKCFTKKQLVSNCVFREHNITKILSKKTTYNKAVAEMNRIQLEEFYASHGYLNFKVINTEVIFNKQTNKVNLIFEVEENKQFIVEEIEINSDVILCPEITEIINSYKGKAFNKIKSEASIKRIKKLLEQQKIYADVIVDYKELSDGKIKLIYNIRLIQNNYVEKIIITGNSRTKDCVIRNQITIHEGDLFNMSALSTSYRRIYNLGFFKDVNLDFKQTQDGKIIIYINVVEKKTGELDFGAGYSSVNGLFGKVMFSETNILGTGNTVSLGIEKGSRHTSLSGGFYKNNIFDSILGGGATAFYDNFRNEKLHYSNQDLGGSLSTSIPIYEDLRLNLRYMLKFNRIYDIREGASNFIRDHREKTTSSALMYQFTYDKRNVADYPTNGYLLAFSQDINGLGGDKYFVNSQFVTRYYKTLFYLDDAESDSNAVVLQIRNDFSYLFAFNNYLFDINDRLFLSEFRGFEAVKGISPRVKNIDENKFEAIGGDLYFFGSAQIEFPINIIQDINLKGHFFADYGLLNCLDKKIFNQKQIDKGENIVFNNNKLRLSVGAGISFTTPIAPIGLDFAVPIIYDDRFDKIQYIYLSLSKRL